MIDVDNLSFERPWGEVLHAIGFVARTGVALAVIGPPGAGKSDLLRCIAGLETPTRGRVSVAGVDPARDPRGAHARLGYVADAFGLYDRLSVWRCLWYAARSRGVPETVAADAVEAAAARVGLTPSLATPAGALSAGQRLALAIGQAVAHGPRVLLLDAPMAGLAAPARASMAALIASFAAEGLTVVVSAPDLALLDGCCTDLLALEEGRVVGDGVERYGATRMRQTL